MSLRQAADIHKLRRDPLPPALVSSALEYRRAHAATMIAQGIPVIVSPDQPPVQAEAWKWCVTCTTVDCNNRPLFGWAIACCFDCGAVYEGLALPEDWVEIERLLELRPRRSSRTWLATESLNDLRAQNLLIGAPV